MPKPNALNRRQFTLLLAAAGTPALGGCKEKTPADPAREGVDVGDKSWATKLVPAEQVERAGAQQYVQMMRQAAAKNALAPNDDPQLQRLRAIAQRVIPLSVPWNPRAKEWRWEVNLVYSAQLNAFCIPGGKIAFFYGILEKLKLTDDEVAMVMGHEIAHALREHARERMGKSMATDGAIQLGAAFLGLGNMGHYMANLGGQLLKLTYSRSDESEADLVGMELAARAGYDPKAGVTLWQKMAAAAKGAPPQWLSTHPAGATRIQDIERNLPKVESLYAKAEKPPRRFEIALPRSARPQQQPSLLQPG
jgi:predicted Zn-dependent protease